MILDVIAVTVLSVLCTLLFMALLHQRRSRLSLLDKYVKVEIEKSIILDRLGELQREVEVKGVEESDGFLKFISESRDWAFTYIEDVQAALKEFDTKISPYLLKSPKDTGKPETAEQKALIRISKEYEKLKQMLPNDMVN